MRNATFIPPRTSAHLALLLAAVLQVVAPVAAQASADTDKDGKISDAERAKRDADKVFSFIKFHTVRPAAAPAAAAQRPVPRPAVVQAAVTPAAVAPAQASTPAAAVSRALSLPTPAAPAEAPAAVATAAAASKVALDNGTPPSPTASSLPPSGSLPVSALPHAAVTQPLPEPEPRLEEEVPLKLIAYVAPEMNAQVLGAMNAAQVVVPVRFVVQPDGKVSSAVVTGNAPRRVGQAAVRAVQQWRFDKIPAVREVDVEIAFKSGE